MHWLFSCAVFLRNIVEHVGHFNIGLVQVAFWLISIRHLNVQLNSFGAKMGVSKEVTLDFGNAFGWETDICSSSLVMPASKLVVRLTWLLKFDTTMFCSARTSPSMKFIFSARSLHKTRFMCPVSSAKVICLLALFSG